MSVAALVVVCCAVVLLSMKKLDLQIVVQGFIIHLAARVVLGFTENSQEIKRRHCTCTYILYSTVL